MADMMPGKNYNLQQSKDIKKKKIKYYDIEKAVELEVNDIKEPKTLKQPIVKVVMMNYIDNMIYYDYYDDRDSSYNNDNYYNPEYNTKENYSCNERLFDMHNVVAMGDIFGGGE